MRNSAHGDVWKVWLFAAAVVALAVWIAPLVYGAGQALAEVSASRTTNGPLEWFGALCRRADFPRFYQAGMVLAAAVLFFPWLQWLHPERVAGEEETEVAAEAGGQALRKNPRGLWQFGAGFLWVVGLWWVIAIVLVGVGARVASYPQGGLGWLATRNAAAALVIALAIEGFFRGIAMGVFLRAMRPAWAIAMTAGFFALVLAVIPPPGLNVADPEASAAGIELLRLMIGHLSAWQGIGGSLLPWLALGGVLAYARWRSASLWLPIGLHAGWLFAAAMLHDLSVPSTANPAAESPISPMLLVQQCFVPLCVIALAGWLAQILTPPPSDEPSARS